MVNRCKDEYCVRYGKDEIDCEHGQSRDGVVHEEEIMQALVFCSFDKRCDRFEVVLSEEPGGQWLELVEEADRVIDDHSFLSSWRFSIILICLAKIGANHDEQEQHKLVVG
jgi:hypothetical protein